MYAERMIKKIKTILVAGARPNFMKIAPLLAEMKKTPEFGTMLVHTGQHYDDNMSKVFFDELEIPRPDINLEVGSSSHAIQTAQIMMGFEPVLLDYKPELVVVVGDVNSTIACALVASKLGIKTAHVEAGLRSRNWNMPEEINRVLTDRISDYLFTTSKDADENLKQEGIPENRIHFVGNVMIDTLIKNLKKSKSSSIVEDLHLTPGMYAVLTLHRPANVDSKEQLAHLFHIFNDIQKSIPIVYPAHPRTRKMIEKMHLSSQIEKMKDFFMIDPLGYLDFLHLMHNSTFTMTDSGGIQEETTILGIPCLTLREETERPVTITQGTNILVKRDRKEIMAAVERILTGQFKPDRKPEKWDGKAGIRIVSILKKSFLG
jgi:UDP-N-acetylglucosamine 2-epimerase (non-hydrolysing)